MSEALSFVGVAQRFLFLANLLKRWSAQQTQAK